MKIYAKQINPEFQESLLFEDGLFLKIWLFVAIGILRNEKRRFLH